jgi:hypothetical protein
MNANRRHRGPEELDAHMTIRDGSELVTPKTANGLAAAGVRDPARFL